MRAATSVASSIVPSGPGGVTMTIPSRPRPRPGSSSSARPTGKRPCRAGHSRRPTGSARIRSPAKAPGRISCSHISSGFWSSWNLRIESAANSIASRTSRIERLLRARRNPPRVAAMRRRLDRRLVELAGEAGERLVAFAARTASMMARTLSSIGREIGLGAVSSCGRSAARQASRVVEVDVAGHGRSVSQSEARVPPSTGRHAPVI